MRNFSLAHKGRNRTAAERNFNPRSKSRIHTEISSHTRICRTEFKLWRTSTLPHKKVKLGHLPLRSHALRLPPTSLCAFNHLWAWGGTSFVAASSPWSRCLAFRSTTRNNPRAMVYWTTMETLSTHVRCSTRRVAPTSHLRMVHPCKGFLAASRRWEATRLVKWGPWDPSTRATLARLTTS